MNNRKEKKGVYTGKVVDDTLVVAKDFKCQTPFWNYQVATYRDTEPFSNLKIMLDEHLEKLFSGQLDAGNGDILDCLIADCAREQFHSLALQRIDHGNTLIKFDIQRQGAISAFRDHLDALKKKRSEVQQEMEELKERYQTDRFERSADYE